MHFWLDSTTCHFCAGRAQSPCYRQIKLHLAKADPPWSGYGHEPFCCPSAGGSLAWISFALLGAALFVFVIASYLLHGREVPGFTFLAAVILLFAGAQLSVLGIIGDPFPGSIFAFLKNLHSSLRKSFESFDASHAM